MSLRTATIRLAYENPSLRPHLLPLLTKRADAEHKPGDVWRTDEGNWRAMNSEGAAKSFGPDKEGAESYAGKGGGKSESGEKGGEGGKRMTVEVKGAAMATSEAVKSEQGKGEDILRKTLGAEKANALIENRKKRDGDKAHITLLSPADTKKAIAHMAEKEGISKGEAERKVKALAAGGVPENFTVKGVGKAEKDGKEAYYATVEWPAGDEFRKSLGLPTGDEEGAQHFHITLGFGDDGDVHGVSKRDTSVGKTASLSSTRNDTMSTLRSGLIRLAYQNPDLRPTLLPLLFGKEAGEVIDLAERRKLLQTLRSPLPDLPESVDEAGDYAAIVSLLRRLQAGDKVVVTYTDNMRGGEVKTQRVVDKSWQDLKAEYPGKFKSPMVLLQAKVKGRFKGGMIQDYGERYGVQWQPTMNTPVTQVLSLKKV